MKFFIPILAVSLLLVGCIGYPPADNIYSYKGITIAKDSIPSNCEGLTGCEMFACMVSPCWCKQGPENGMVGSAGKQILSEKDAEAAIQAHLASKGIVPATVRAAKLNELFYNVFYEIDGNEEVLTVEIDGTIMETVCGV